MAASGKLKVFISYSRADAKFADELVAGLEFKEEFEVTIDRHSIIEGEDWKKRLGALIADADTVVFILSPDSAQSPICGWEVEEAHRLSKRILPVLARPVGGIPAPPLLAALNYVRFDEERTYISGLAALVRSLKTDVDWLREHTRLLILALSWDGAKRPANRLLSGNDIIAAKEWLARRPKDSPEATVLHLDFLRASERAEDDRLSAERKQLADMAAAQTQRAGALAEREAAVKRLQVWTRRGITAATAGALGGAGLGYWGYDAERRVRLEQENTKTAAAKALEDAIQKQAIRTDIAGQLVAYAAAPGEFAMDGPTGGHSPFTEAMLASLSERSVGVFGAISRCNERVLQLTGSKQRPYFTSDLNGDVFLLRLPQSRRRVALVVSLNSFKSAAGTHTLDNVARDAEAWRKLLVKADFATVDLANPTFHELNVAIDALGSTAPHRKGSMEAPAVHRAGFSPTSNIVSVMIYLGVGFTVAGRDYLSAKDTDGNFNKLSTTSLELRSALDRLRKRSAVSIVVLDTNFNVLVEGPDGRPMNER